MAVLTGADGQLRYNNQAIAKCKNWQLNISRNAIETTCLASYDREYVQGLRGTSGSMTLLYDPEQMNANNLLNSVLSDGRSEEVSFVLNRADGSTFRCNGFLTQTSVSVSTGAASACSCQFVVSGKPEGEF